MSENRFRHADMDVPQNTHEHSNPHERNKGEMEEEIQREIAFSHMQKVFATEWFNACRAFPVQCRLWPCRTLQLLQNDPSVERNRWAIRAAEDHKKLPQDLWQAQINQPAAPQPQGPSPLTSSHLDQQRSPFQFNFSSLNWMPCLQYREELGGKVKSQHGCLTNDLLLITVKWLAVNKTVLSMLDYCGALKSRSKTDFFFVGYRFYGSGFRNDFCK